MWLWRCLVPHPPIIIPEVGQGREKEASKTIGAMETLAKSLSELVPEVVFLLTPHSDYGQGLCFITAEKYSGDLSMFGHPEVSLSFSGNPEEAKFIEKALATSGIPTKNFFSSEIFLDHASFIPLYFLSKYWRKKPSIIIANPIGLSPEEALATGQLMGEMKFKTKFGMIASGDLSHRLTKNAPAGFHKDGQIFDRLLVRSLKENNPKIILGAGDTIFANAGECGLRSAMLFLGCSQNRNIDVLSYEGPYGVGYCVAKSMGTEEHWNHNDPYIEIARGAITCYLNGLTHKTTTTASEALPKLGKPGACFVSLKDPNGNLRGCIGTISPQKADLASEIAENAVSAAIRDPRFPPVTLKELENITISVDILTEPEKTESIGDLDVKEFGIIVEKGYRRGVLLPDLEGVTSVDQQIRIAALKAGISDLNGSVVYRFKVERHSAKEIY